MKRVPLLRCLALTGAVLCAAGSFTPAKAQADPDDVKRAVARISLINGDVTVRRGDSGDWVAGAINAPMLTDDEISAPPEARAEVQLDAAHAVRVGGDTQVRFTELEYGHYQLEVLRGTITYRILRDSDATVEVDTPSISVHPTEKGTYRIAVNDAGETQVTVRDGNAEIFTPTGSQRLREGQTMLARGSASDPEFQIVRAAARDDWDRWNESRDRVLLASKSSRYVPDGIYGYEDLDSYGNWDYVPEYGYCWRPSVAVGWSPYSVGRWSWLDWYGWTWVSYDPWGWAPYHYGRWFNYSNRWYWYPGVRYTRHYWSPALVAFFGWGGGGVSIGFGNVGWVPLAPYETFHPWWGRAYYGRPAYINRSVNIVNVNVTNVYRNSRYNGVVGVSGSDFRDGRFGGMRRYNGNQITQASVMQGGMPVAPGSQHLRFNDRQVTNIPRPAGNSQIFRRNQPDRTERIPFSQQQRAFEQAGFGGRGGGDNRGDNRGGVQAPVGGPGRAGRGGEAAPSIGNRNDGRANPVMGRSAQNDQAPAGQWRRFGTPRGGDSAPAGNARPAANPGGIDRGGGQARPQVETRTQDPPDGRDSGARGNPGGIDRGGGQARPQVETRTQDRPDGRDSGSRGPWQRFGATENRDSGGSRPAAQQPAPPSAPQSDRGWSRFGSPTTERPRGSAPAVDRGNGEFRGAQPQARPESSPQSRRDERFSAPSMPQQRSERFSAPSMPQAQPQQRREERFSAPPAPRESRPSAPAGGGFSAPRPSAPSGGGYNAPRSAPSGGGGGGGVSRSNGGGGGSGERGNGRRSR